MLVGADDLAMILADFLGADLAGLAGSDVSTFRVSSARFLLLGLADDLTSEPEFFLELPMTVRG